MPGMLLGVRAKQAFALKQPFAFATSRCDDALPAVV